LKPRSRGRRCLLLTLLTVPAIGASADPAPPLRWREVAALIATAPAVREAEARAAAAAGATEAAAAVPNPSVTVTGADAEARFGTERRREWGVAVEVPLEFLATRGARVEAGRAAERAAAADAEGVRVEVRRAVRRAFIALAHAEAQLEGQLLLEEELGQLTGLVRKRAERGEARPTEVPRVEIELERLGAAIGRTRSLVEALRARLSTTLGVPVARVEADLDRPLDVPPLAALERRLGEGAPGLVAARARLAAASGELDAERRERVPKLALGAGHVEELDRRATSLSATVTFPLWNWNGGKIRQSQANVVAERARLEALSREVRGTASEAWHACAAGQASAARFREQVAPRAESAARTTRRAYELGESGLLDVLDTRRVLLDTRREYLDLLLDMQNACGDLAALAGLELP
jgi:cobalt-zinc-cadmium efflux system outer membrane protein